MRLVGHAYQETPSRVLLLDPGALPITASGKLMRRAAHQARLDAPARTRAALFTTPP